MTVKELRKRLFEIENQNARIMLGVEGYTAQNIRISSAGSRVCLSDNGYYDGFSGGPGPEENTELKELSEIIFDYLMPWDACDISAEYIADALEENPLEVVKMLVNIIEDERGTK